MNDTRLNLIGLIQVEHCQGANVICSRYDASNKKSSERDAFVSRNFLN